VRSWAPQGFPNHRIFYKVSGDDIEVIRFLHGAPDLPRYLEEDR
jgi:plasmid stabilization system protein ParE